LIGPRTQGRVARTLRPGSCKLGPVVVGFFLALLELSGCGPDSSEGSGPSGSPSGFAQIDSSGVLISVTHGTNAHASIGWEVDSIPNLVLGAGSEPSEQFFRIGGLRGFSDGSILVVDGASRELRFFDSEGRLLDRVGRKGEGPGEFDDPVLVPTVGSDSLLLWDTGLIRFQVFSSNGLDHQTIRLTKKWPGGSRPPVGAVDYQVLAEKREGPNLADLREGGPKEWERVFVWVDPASGVERRIVSFTVVRDYVFLEGGGAPRMSLIPFSPVPVATVSRDGALISRGSLSEIRGYDLEGELRRIFRVDESGRPVTPRMIEAKLALEGTGSPSSRNRWERLYAQMPIPDTLPVFQSLQIDDTGWLWAKIYEWDPTQPPEWMVFDPEGRAHGIVETPAGLEVQWIGADCILGVWLDEFRVEHVRRHALRRTGPPVGNPQRQ